MSFTLCARLCSCLFVLASFGVYCARVGRFMLDSPRLYRF